MVLNDTECYQIVTNGSKWYQMVTNGTKWFPMAPNGHQSHKWIYICWQNGQMEAQDGSTSDWIPPTEIFSMLIRTKKRSTPRNFFTSSLLWEVVTHKSESKYFWGMIKCRLGKLKLQTGYLEQKMFISDISKATLTLILILLDHSVSVFMGKKRKSYQGSTLVAFSFLQREIAPQ